MEELERLQLNIQLPAGALEGFTRLAEQLRLLAEALGGGGNAGAAGAQIPGKSVGQVLVELHAALDQYFDDRSAEPL